MWRTWWAASEMGLAFARRSLSLRVRVARDGTSRVLVTHMSSPEALVWELRDSDTREDTVVDLFKSAETSMSTRVQSASSYGQTLDNVHRRG